MNWILWGLAFFLLGAPTAMLMLDRLAGLSAKRSFRTQGLPALLVFIALGLYTFVVDDPLFELIWWGFVGGIVGTIALDAVRLPGVRAGAFPMDMPMMFGAMVLGVAPVVQRKIVAQVVEDIAALPPEAREREMLARMMYLAVAPAWRRRLLMSGMLEGLRRLPQEQADAMRRSQIGILTALPEKHRVAMMKTMDELMMGVPPANEPLRARLQNPSEIKLPQIAMRDFRAKAKKAFLEASEETKVSRRSTATAGYAWHFVNGATYGIAFTLLFGAGSWPLVLLWGVFVWAIMMVSMPKMMPMVRFPRSFPVVPLLAHVAMAIPIGYFAINFVSASGSSSSLVAGAGLEWLLRALGLAGGLGILSIAATRRVEPVESQFRSDPNANRRR